MNRYSVKVVYKCDKTSSNMTVRVDAKSDAEAKEAAIKSVKHGMPRGVKDCVFSIESAIRV
jgi:hypothetical protein